MQQPPLFVSTDWLEERLDDPKLRIVDATTYLKPTPDGPEIWSGEETYKENHIPSAVFADLMNDFSDPDSGLGFTKPSRERFVEKIEALGIGDEDTYTVIYDQGYAVVGADFIASDWASRFAWQLLYEGYDNIAILDGGLAKWKEEGKALASGVETYPASTFSGERQDDLFVSKEEVEQAIGDENTLLVNSLTEQDFNNGRIPTSCNIPFVAHSDHQTKELLDDEQLKDAFEKAGALDKDKKIITYCGGGIAATWNAVLLRKLGHDNVAVYDGSMAEWASDPDTEIEK
ncbi:sulfurtransferase [Halobacillus litoralis]|uniref:sulfurtransferase n=1 Tax=Halobacillus litoralis TaxID=45668 RepID=UPI001CD655D9|nr:sulfurtransferase [Halobacillus litoralis]MCA0971367.1 sulfurtransferase [Halobacillus litoralis]